MIPVTETLPSEATDRQEPLRPLRQRDTRRPYEARCRHVRIQVNRRAREASGAE